MDHICEQIRPLLFKVAEGEAAPDEALEVGRHLPDCTVCRIRLAREVRLEQLVSEMDEPIEVDERFLEQVMASLPEGPPPKRAALRSGNTRRGLKLAGFIIAFAMLGASGYHLSPAIGNVAVLPELPSMEFEGFARLLGGAREQIQFLLAALAGIGTRSTPDLPAAPSFLHLALVVFTPLMAVLLSAGAFLMVAARTLVRKAGRSQAP